MANTRHSYKVIRNRSRNKKSVKKTFKTVTKKNKRKIRSRIMKGGMEDGNEDIMEIEIRTEEETKRIKVDSNSTVIMSILDFIGDSGSLAYWACWGDNNRFILLDENEENPFWGYVTMGDQEIALEETYVDNGIEDGARLNIHKGEKISFEDVIDEIKKLYPGIDEEKLMSLRYRHRMSAVPRESRLWADLDYYGPSVADLMVDLKDHISRPRSGFGSPCGWEWADAIKYSEEENKNN